MDPFTGVLPSYIFGAPFWPFLVCTVVAGIVAVGVMGKVDGPLLFFGCAVVGWIAAILFRGAVYLIRSVNWVSAGTIAMWVFCILLTVVVVIITLAVAADHFGKGIGIGLPPPPPPPQARPTIMYHGTKTLQWGKDILLNKRWKIGASGGVWITSILNTARQYAGGVGVIVEVHVSSSAHLSGGNGVWYVSFPNLIGRYVRLKGVTPKKLLDSNGNQIM